jgi:hypothetical protein
MSQFDLLSAVQPTEGWFAIIGIKDKGVVQKFTQSREEVDVIAAKFMAQKRNVFFGVAKYKEEGSRKKDNVKALKAFWLDIDCGEAKAEVNEKTGRPDGYIDQATGLQELKRFCKLVGMPKPVLVNSGRGIHVYWPLTEEVTREEWEPVADRLRELCNTHDLYVDPAVFEAARVLRIPGTLNFKDEPPTEVTVLYEGSAVDFGAFKALLGVEERKPKFEAPKRELSELAKSLQANIDTSFAKIMRRSAAGNGCQQLWDSYQNRAELPEPRWFDALSVAKFCSDKDKAIHKLSSGHPDYDPVATEAKIKHILGPHNCEIFERHNPGGCDGCPFKDKIKNPIVLGKDIIEATEEDNTVIEEAEEEGEEDIIHKIPAYPFPYFRGKNGGVYLRPKEQEEEPILVYEDDLYVVKRMVDPNLGDIVVIKLHTRADGVREFTMPNRDVSDKTELRGMLASKGVVCETKQFNLVMSYIIKSIKELQDKRADTMRLQFGWADNDSKFIIGDKEIGVDGTFYSPPSSVTRPWADKMHTSGTLEKWKEVFNLYGSPGLEPHAFAALTAFGSPLFKFTGQSGAILNLIHPRSGTGKTTILNMCNSVYGNPQLMLLNKEDTANSRMQIVGMLRHLPPTMDEITNMTAEKVSDFAYAVPQGRAKERMKGSTNELRHNATTWQLVAMTTSNVSLYERLAANKSAPEGEMMRIVEYKIDYTSALDIAHAKEMFDHQLMQNYGHAGLIFAEYLVKNRDEVEKAVQKTQAYFDQKLKLTQRERFWSSLVGANMAGAVIAKRLGLLDWDLEAVTDWVCSMVEDIRHQVTAPVSSEVGILGDFINRHMQNILVIDDGADRRTGLNVAPRLEPKGELIIRWEPDTKRMYLVSKAFRADCAKYQTNYHETIQALKKRGMLVDGGDKRMGKGTNIMSTSVHALIFDTNHPDFMGFSDIVPEEKTDAGGES